MFVSLLYLIWVTFLLTVMNGLGLNLMKVPDEDPTQIICTMALLRKYFYSGETLSGSVLSITITSASMQLQQKLLQAMHKDTTHPWSIVLRNIRKDIPKTGRDAVLNEKPQCYFLVVESLENEDIDDIFDDWKNSVNWNPLAQFVVYMASLEDTDDEMSEMMIEILLDFMNKKIFNVNVLGQSEENGFYFGKTTFPYHPDNNCGNRVISVETLDICDYQDKNSDRKEDEDGDGDYDDEDGIEDGNGGGIGDGNGDGIGDGIESGNGDVYIESDDGHRNDEGNKGENEGNEGNNMEGDEIEDQKVHNCKNGNSFKNKENNLNEKNKNMKHETEMAECKHNEEKNNEDNSQSDGKGNNEVRSNEDKSAEVIENKKDNNEGGNNEYNTDNGYMNAIEIKKENEDKRSIENNKKLSNKNEKDSISEEDRSSNNMEENNRDYRENIYEKETEVRKDDKNKKSKVDRNDAKIELKSKTKVGNKKQEGSAQADNKGKKENELRKSNQDQKNKQDCVENKENDGDERSNKKNIVDKPERMHGENFQNKGDKDYIAETKNMHDKAESHKNYKIKNHYETIGTKRMRERKNFKDLKTQRSTQKRLKNFQQKKPSDDHSNVSSNATSSGKEPIMKSAHVNQNKTETLNFQWNCTKKLYESPCNNTVDFKTINFNNKSTGNSTARIERDLQTDPDEPKIYIEQLYRALFLDKIPRDLKGCPIVAAYRPWEPYIFNEDGDKEADYEENVEMLYNDDYYDDKKSKQKLTGIEYELLQTIGEVLHVNINLRVKNRNLYQLFQQLVDGDIELLLGGVDEDPSISQFVASTVPYHQDDLTWCVAKAKRKQTLFNFLASFELGTWMLTLTFIFVASFSVLISQRLLRIYVIPTNGYIFTAIRMLGIVVSQSIELPSVSTTFKLLFGTSFFMGLMFSNVYQSFLISTLTNPRSSYQISHVEEIYNNRMFIAGSVENVRHLNKQGEMFKYFRQQFQMCYNIEECLQRAATDERLAVTVSRQHAFYNPRIPRDDLYCFDRNENLYVYLVTMLLPKKFHLMHKINPVVQHVIESGHMEKWARDLDSKRIIKDEIHKVREDSFRSLKLSEVGGTFVFSSIWLLSALVVLLLERWVHRKVLKERTRKCLDTFFITIDDSEAVDPASILGETRV